MSPKASVAARLSQCLPPPTTSSREDPFLVDRNEGRFHTTKTENLQQEGLSSFFPTPSVATSADGGSEHLSQVVPTSAAVIVYAFNAADELVEGLNTAADSRHRENHTGVGGDTDDHRKCMLVRATAGNGTGSGSNHGGGNGFDGFGPALAAGLSRPVLAEEMGETHLWVVDYVGRRHLAAAFVSIQRATIFITLSASTQLPPFRVENRSSAETLAYRQVGFRPG